MLSSVSFPHNSVASEELQLHPFYIGREGVGLLDTSPWSLSVFFIYHKEQSPRE